VPIAAVQNGHGNLIFVGKLLKMRRYLELLRRNPMSYNNDYVK
jgi:hypothetical protein